MPPQEVYLKNQDFLLEDRDGAMVFHVENHPCTIFDIHDDGDVVVIGSKDNDPAVILELDPAYPDTWKKSSFAQLGKIADPFLVKEAEKRFGESYQNILKSKRTIGAMTTVAFVFDDATVKIAVVQRTSKGPDGTSNMGALSRFGGGVCGGKNGKGIHGAQHLGNQTIREFLEEFHPFLKSESGVLTPLNIIPQGYEVDGLKGAFMKSVMNIRQGIASTINNNLQRQGYEIGGAEFLRAFPLSVAGLTKPVIQIIDGQQVLHPDVVTFDAQATSKNLDFNTDLLFAVRVEGCSPDDFVLKDGETDQKTGAFLDRIIFFGAPDDLKRAVDGEIIPFHSQSDVFKPAAFSPAFVPILRKSHDIVQAALEYL